MAHVSSTELMSHLIPAAANRPGDDPIFAVNSEAERRRRAGHRVINASLGALMEDDGTLAVLPTVNEALRTVDQRRAAAYAPIAGDTAFCSAVVRDVFEGSDLADKAIAVATAGGTGAVHHAVVNFLDPGQALTTTSHYWGPYSIIATHTGRAVEPFSMFTPAGTFDVDAFGRGLDLAVARQDRALVVLNSPCHNPTGYSLDGDEWRAVVDLACRAGRRAPVTLLVDLAYARYGGPGSERWIDAMGPLVDRCALLVAWSASKAYTQYGARVGALVAVVRDHDERARIRNALAYSCRGTWSNCNHLGQLAVTTLLSDPGLRARVDAERGRLRALLGERVDVFKREAARLGLRTPRYEGGFFVAVFTSDAAATTAAARAEDLFVVPISGAVRVALCSTPKADVPRLVEILARAVR